MDCNTINNEKTMGIYSITNKINGKIYIGSSVDIYKRVRNHIRVLKNNKHENKYLQNSFNKNGIESFNVEIVEKVSKKEILLIKEQYYMDKLKAYDRVKGYNICMYATGGGLFGEDNGSYGKGHLQKGKLNHFYGKSHSEEVIMMLSDNAKKRVGKLNPNYNNRHGENPISLNVIQIDVKSKLKINEYDSITRAYQAMGRKSVSGGISSACKSFSEGVLVNCLGYFWCYSKDYENIKNAKVAVSKKEKPIVKLDKNTLHFISEHPTLEEASKSNQVCRHGISRVARGINKVCGGYKWMYKEEYEKLVTQ